MTEANNNQEYGIRKSGWPRKVRPFLLLERGGGKKSVIRSNGRQALLFKKKRNDEDSEDEDETLGNDIPEVTVETLKP